MKTVPTSVGLVADREPQMACTAPDVDIELFFPVGTSGPALLQTAEAKAICWSCPILKSCRTAALERPDLYRHGVFGGLSEDERRAILRRAGQRREPTR
ncbi:WhiB family transcriptional regulator, redox-sensing transcriptional regulator [Pseudonocardia ammonioxydans]|uniref:WhiB family transcriptional regulator, redox-sensing transcriptional regulator n=2 Tax=Pseudonocardia ammonioxydans TaxID=260086 RepID=A0A1I5HZM4_PSUAM|nr:WhiB family transcriptional regulator, redox-sensing transcriptional regulator [Pseudonocardia ammonioxydans]